MRQARRRRRQSALVADVQRLLRRIAQEILKRHQAGRAAEDVVADFRLHVDHQLVENLERLGLVFQQRIALAVRAQADAVRRLSISYRCSCHSLSIACRIV